MFENLADMLAVVQSETLRNTLNDVEAKALLDVVAETVAVVENAKYRKTIGDVKAKNWLTRWLTNGRFQDFSFAKS